MTDLSRLMTQKEAERIVSRIRRFVRKDDRDTIITVQGWWNGELRWARNRVTLASDRRDLIIRISCGGGEATTNQTDDASLEAVVRCAERSGSLLNRRIEPVMSVHDPELSILPSTIWSDATYSMTASQRGEVAQAIADIAVERSLMSAGYIEVRAGTIATCETGFDSPPAVRYAKYSQSQCSVTVRHPQGIGSGWAGGSSYDWSSIDSGALATRALEKCIASLNPVSIEPGRYTTILEPQAVCDLMDPLMIWLNSRQAAEGGLGPFFLERDWALRLNRSKLGLKVVDERISISHDPTDPLLGIVLKPGVRAVTWIENGVLKSLSYPRAYALKELNENLPDERRLSYRMSGGTAGIDDMITSTERGLLITRFWNLVLIDRRSVLLTGVTRDGLWLVEHGKVSKAVKNLRFTESPLFVLNQIEQLGAPVPVFHPVKDPYIADLMPVVVPALKVNDFSFTSTVDAV